MVFGFGLIVEFMKFIYVLFYMLVLKEKDYVFFQKFVDLGEGR